jgi:drug/metabolite transporter (DMT)-like permease
MKESCYHSLFLLIAVSLLGEPIGATILAYIIFAEALTWTKLVGGSLILAAIYLAARGEKINRRADSF